MIDLGVIGNFISSTLVGLYGLLTRRKEKPYDLGIADGLVLLKKVGLETFDLLVTI